jgi:hypothetical protein
MFLSRTGNKQVSQRRTYKQFICAVTGAIALLLTKAKKGQLSAKLALTFAQGVKS